MQPLEKLGVFALVVVIGLLVYWYIKFIKNGEPLDPSDKDWKKTRDEELYPLIAEFKVWLDDVAVKTGEWHSKIEVVFGKMIKQMWNDGGNWMNIILEFFKQIGRAISWNKYRVVYCILALIIFGLVKYYIFDKMGA